MALLLVSLALSSLAVPAGREARGAADPGGAGSEDRVDRMKEYQVKAGFLANFIKYTKWPRESFDSDDAPFVVLVVGDNRYATVIERVLEGLEFGGHPIDVRTATRAPRRVEAHVVFATQVSGVQAARLIRECANRPILLVGEMEGFAVAGGGLNFYLSGGRIRFEANPQVLGRAGLVVSSELLKLARIVREERR